MENTRLSRGLECLRKVDPQNAETLLRRFEAISPVLARYAIEFGYGEVMSSDVLDLKTRELLNVAMLGALGTAPLQLEMHVRSALFVGATKDEIVEVILQIAGYAGFPVAFNTMLALERALAAQATANKPNT